MHRTFLRQVLIALLCLSALAGCGGGQTEARRARAPLRDVFPPPSLEPQAGATEKTAQPAAAAAGAATVAAAATSQPSREPSPPPAEAAAALKAPPPSLEPPAELKAPLASSEPAGSLKAPTLADEPAGARGSISTESGQSIDLEKEFEALAAPAAAKEPGSAAAPAPEPSAAVPTAVPSARAAEPAATSSTAPTRIIVATHPALLVSIQGEPVYGPVQGTKLQRVLNTSAFLVKGGSGTYYLSVYDGFMRAAKLAGPWTVLSAPPRVVQEAKARAMAHGEADVLAGRAEAGTGQRPTLKQPAPQIIVSTEPVALVVIKGDPAYEPVEGTRLSRVVNTDARLFVHRAEDRIYVQLGERWYRAASLKGPWEPVAPAALPDGLEQAATRNG